MLKKLEQRINLSRNLKKLIKPGCVIEITKWRDIDGTIHNKKWEIVEVSINKGPTEFYDYFIYKNEKDCELLQTFTTLSCILMNSEKYNVYIK